jgi:hypothetical protein
MNVDVTLKELFELRLQTASDCQCASCLDLEHALTTIKSHILPRRGHPYFDVPDSFWCSALLNALGKGPQSTAHPEKPKWLYHIHRGDMLDFTMKEDVAVDMGTNIPIGAAPGRFHPCSNFMDGSFTQYETTFWTALDLEHLTASLPSEIIKSRLQIGLNSADMRHILFKIPFNPKLDCKVPTEADGVSHAPFVLRPLGNSESRGASLDLSDLSRLDLVATEVILSAPPLTDMKFCVIEVSDAYLWSDAMRTARNSSELGRSAGIYPWTTLAPALLKFWQDNEKCFHA